MKKSDFLYGNGKTRIFGVSDDYTTNSSDVVASTKCVYDAIKSSSNTTHFGSCSTEAATAAKVVSVPNFVLATGAEVTVQFTVTNTATSPTLNVNNTGAKAIVYRNAAISAGYLAANRVYKFVYDGTNYELIGDLDTNTKYTAASATPKAPGTAAVGTSSKYAREDHVHPLQTTVSGNAGSATKLATARTIGITGVVTGTATSFDGSKNITIDTTTLNLEDASVTGELSTSHGGTGRTDGKAVGLVTKRTIDGVYFDGTANITHFGTCSTAAATAAKVVSVTNFTLATGAVVYVRFTVTNTASSPTLNVNSTGAKAIRYRNSAITASYLAANRTYCFIYDGTYYQLVGDIDTNTTYSVATSSKAGLVMPDDSSLKIVDASSGKVSVEDVLYNGTISLIESGALGKARYITSSESFNVDTDDFDLVLVNTSGHDGVYPSGFSGFIYVRQLYYSRTSSSVIGNRMQLAFAYNANHTWSRYYIDGVWSDWVKFVKGTDLATTSKAGIVQLNNTVTSTSTTQAATANVVKMAYDKAVEASESTGRSETADKLTTARTIQTNLASTAAGSFDGSKNITVGVSGVLPVVNGGTGRTDGKAPSLVTARTIGITGVVTGTATAFDGTKNISIDATKLNIEDTGVTGELPIAHGGTGRTDGKAVGLVTKRTIDGVYFDGTANITHFGSCSTAAATAAKVVSVPNFVLATGAEVTVRFTVTNTAASPTLNVNNTGAKAIVYRNAAISAGYLAANRVYKFVYDGTNYELIGDIDTNTTYSNATTSKAGIVQLNDTVTSTSTTQAATANAVKLAYDKANSALPKAGGTLTGAVVEKISALSGTSVALDLKTSNNFTHTATANTTFTVAANTGTSFQLGTLVLTNAGNYTITWPESFKWADNTPPTLNSEGIDVITFFTVDGGTTYYAAQVMTGIA